MLPVFINKSESDSGPTQVPTFTATLPGSLVVGNALVMVVPIMLSGTTPNPTVPGWTLVFTSPGWGLGGWAKLAIFVRRIDGTETNPVISNAGGANVYYAAAIAQYGSVASTGSLVDGTPSTGVLSIAATAEAPAYTTTANDSMILALAAGNDVTTYSLDWPENVQRMSAINPVAFQCAVSELAKTAIGTRAAGLWTRGGGNQAWGGWAIGLRGNVTVAPPVADFYGSAPRSGQVPLTVNFTDNSQNVPTSWSWDFGDGGTSTVRNPTHVYSVAGTYNVTLTVTNANGTNSVTRGGYVLPRVTTLGDTLGGIVGEVSTAVPSVAIPLVHDASEPEGASVMRAAAPQSAVLGLDRVGGGARPVVIAPPWQGAGGDGDGETVYVGGGVSIY